jgi:hypothetical protein
MYENLKAGLNFLFVFSQIVWNCIFMITDTVTATGACLDINGKVDYPGGPKEGGG